MRTLAFPSLAAAALLGLSACAGSPHHPAMADTHHGAHAQHGVPDAVKVPPGHRVAMHTVGVGEITYECRAKADAAGGHAWAFAGPEAALNDRSGAQVGRYFGPPATWAAKDGSRITGTQVGLAPGRPGSIALQLVKANPAMGAGTMTDVAYVQRLDTRGGVAPALACAAANLGAKALVKYQADYLFWKAT